MILVDFYYFTNTTVRFLMISDRKTYYYKTHCPICEIINTTNLKTNLSVHMIIIIDVPSDGLYLFIYVYMRSTTHLVNYNQMVSLQNEFSCDPSDGKLMNKKKNIVHK